MTYIDYSYLSMSLKIIFRDLWFWIGVRFFSYFFHYKIVNFSDGVGSTHYKTNTFCGAWKHKTIQKIYFVLFGFKVSLHSTAKLFLAKSYINLYFQMQTYFSIIFGLNNINFIFFLIMDTNILYIVSHKQDWVGSLQLVWNSLLIVLGKKGG